MPDSLAKLSTRQPVSPRLAIARKFVRRIVLPMFALAGPVHVISREPGTSGYRMQFAWLVGIAAELLYGACQIDFMRFDAKQLATLLTLVMLVVMQLSFWLIGTYRLVIWVPVAPTRYSLGRSPRFGPLAELAPQLNGMFWDVAVAAYWAIGCYAIDHMLWAKWFLFLLVVLVLAHALLLAVFPLEPPRRPRGKPELVPAPYTQPQPA